MVDPTCHSVEGGNEHIGNFGGFVEFLVVRYFDSVRFCKQNPKELLGKVGVNVVVDCPLSTCREHFAHSLRLNDCSIAL